MSDVLLELQFESTRATLRGTETVLGRSIYCSIIISHPSVSRVHASFLRHEGITFVKDLDSKNGTYLNGQRVGTRPMRLHAGDHLRIGDIAAVLRECSQTSRCDTSDRPIHSEEDTTQTLARPRPDRNRGDKA